MALLAAGADIAVHYGPATVRIPDPEHVRAFPGSISADYRNGPVKREGCADFS
jgi:hypothetical protein